MRSTKRAGITFSEKGKTQQHFRREANINSIMARYTKTGILVDASKPMRNMPQFGVFEQFDFLEAQNKVAQAKQAFMCLPARIRQRFQNDPAQLIEFIQHEENRKEAVAIGLISEAPIENPAQPAAPVPPVPAA